MITCLKSTKKTGHKIRSAYYKRKSFKTRTRRYDDVDSFYEGVKDLGMKAVAVSTVAAAGAQYVSKMLKQ